MRGEDFKTTRDDSIITLDTDHTASFVGIRPKELDIPSTGMPHTTRRTCFCTIGEEEFGTGCIQCATGSAQLNRRQVNIRQCALTISIGTVDNCATNVGTGCTEVSTKMDITLRIYTKGLTVVVSTTVTRQVR